MHFLWLSGGDMTICSSNASQLVGYRGGSDGGYTWGQKYPCTEG